MQSSAIRKLLPNLGYTITNEEIFEEKGHIYEIIVADFSEHPVTMTIIPGQILMLAQSLYLDAH